MDLGILFVIAFAGVVFAVGVRLVLLHLRTKKLPELLLGLSQLLPIAGFMVLVAGSVRAHGVPTQLPLQLGGFFIDLGFVALAIFVWRVFRRSSRWGLVGLVVLMIGTALMPPLNYVLHARAYGAPAMVVPRLVLRSICYLWGASEAFVYYRRMARQVRYGLADPIVADRFRLWALALATSVVMLNLVAAGSVMKLAHSALAPPVATTGSLFAALAAGLLWLSFFPPAAYLRRVERRAVGQS